MEWEDGEDESVEVKGKRKRVWEFVGKLYV